MARNTSFTPYEEETVGAYDEEPGGPEFMAYGSAPSMALKDYSLPEDPMPLFLSEGAEESRQRGFGTGGERIREKAVLWPRIFKAGIVAASAAAIAFAILSVGNPLALFADAKASLPAAAADQSGAAQTPNPQPAAAVQLASNGRSTPVIQSTAGVGALPPAAKVTRDDIALALRAAQQNQMQTDPPPAPAAAAPVRRLDADEVAALLKRARGLIEIGDIAPARLLLERAADAQEASAALLLAQTYDPAVLGTPDMRSITPDPAMARSWYQKAARFGSRDAQQRLSQLQN
jgi:TPR repeat protein